MRRKKERTIKRERLRKRKKDRDRQRVRERERDTPAVKIKGVRASNSRVLHVERNGGV